MDAPVIDLLQLYPRDMNIYGDWGNVLVLRKRLQLRGYGAGDERQERDEKRERSGECATQRVPGGRGPKARKLHGPGAGF